MERSIRNALAIMSALLQTLPVSTQLISCTRPTWRCGSSEVFSALMSYRKMQQSEEGKTANHIINLPSSSPPAILPALRTLLLSPKTAYLTLPRWKSTWGLLDLLGTSILMRSTCSNSMKTPFTLSQESKHSKLTLKTPLGSTWKSRRHKWKTRQAWCSLGRPASQTFTIGPSRFRNKAPGLSSRPRLNLTRNTSSPVWVWSMIKACAQLIGRPIASWTG